MRLIELEIKNFRNIVHEKIELEPGANGLMISGANGIGKTNRLEALLWLLGDVLLDGTVRDSMSNLEPFNAEHGVNVSVKATFSDGQSIEKGYTRPHFQNEDGDFIPKNSITRYIINNGKPTTTVREGKQFIYELLGLADLEDLFKRIKFLDKINLVYFLMTTQGIKGFDNNTMRALLTDMVGDVSALDLAKRNPIYKELVSYLEKNNDDINKVREYLRYSIQNKTDGLETRVANSKAVLEQLEVFAKEKLDLDAIKKAENAIKEIDTKITELNVKKEKVTSGETDSIKLQISQVENELLIEKGKVKSAYDLELEKAKDNDLNNQIRNKEDNVFSATKDIRIAESELSNSETKLSVLERELETKRARVEELATKGNGLKTKHDNAKIETNDDEVAIDITCPHCNQAFKSVETKEHKELQEKQLKDLKGKLWSELVDTKVEFEGVKLEIAELNVEIVKARDVVTDKTNTLTNARKNRETLEKELEVLREQLRNETKELPILSYDTPKIKELQDKELKLHEDLEKASDNVYELVTEIETDINILETKKEEHNLVVDKKRAVEENVKALEPRRLEHKKLVDKLTETKELYALSKELLVETFKELERKIEVKFGNNVWFKLYEPNASDGGATFKTTICEMYVKDQHDRLVPALANGVSTSMQELRIAEFIDNVKKHYGVRDSLIIIDRLESLDKNTLKSLTSATGNQIITSRVDYDSSEIKYEVI